jgi:hypothetical protein
VAVPGGDFTVGSGAGLAVDPTSPGEPHLAVDPNWTFDVDKTVRDMVLVEPPSLRRRLHDSQQPAARAAAVTTAGALVDGFQPW